MGMNVGITEYSLAIITTDKNLQVGGGCPIFYANDNDDLQNKAMLMSKCVSGMGETEVPPLLKLIKLRIFPLMLVPSA